jgi:hypothetical protein
MNDQAAVWSIFFDLHDNPDQQKRANSALAKELTPLSLDVDNGCAVFAGSGGNVYETWLNECTCIDFHIRGSVAPCKHMYRLAMEMGLFSSEGRQSDLPAARAKIQIEVIRKFLTSAPFPDAARVFSFINAVFSKAQPSESLPDDELLQDCCLFDYSDPKKIKKNKDLSKHVNTFRSDIKTRIGEALFPYLSEPEMISFIDDFEQRQ